MADDIDAILAQRAEMKRRDPEAILLFRVTEGSWDHYRAFAEDADILDKITEPGTSRLRNYVNNWVGFRPSNLEAVLARIVAAGKRAAVCEPVKGPAPAGAEGKVAGPTRWAYHADHGIITTADGHTLIAEGVAAKDGPLLAAAPDLLEALAELLDDAHREGYSTGPVIRKAAAAIARAEGPG